MRSSEASVMLCFMLQMLIAEFPQLKYAACELTAAAFKKMQTQRSKWHSIIKMKATFDQQSRFPVNSPVAYIVQP